MADGCCLENGKKNHDISKIIWPILMHNGLIRLNDICATISAFCGCHLYCYPFRRRNPRNHNFAGANWRFQTRCSKYLNNNIMETAQPIPARFCTTIKTTRYPSWVVQIRALQIQCSGRPPSCTSRYCDISASHCQTTVWPNFTYSGMVMHLDLSHLWSKNVQFLKIQDGGQRPFYSPNTVY